MLEAFEIDPEGMDNRVCRACDAVTLVSALEESTSVRRGIAVVGVCAYGQLRARRAHQNVDTYPAGVGITECTTFWNAKNEQGFKGCS